VGCTPSGPVPQTSEPSASSAPSAAKALTIPTLEVVDAADLPQTEELDGTRPKPGSYQALLTGDMIESVEWAQVVHTGEMQLSVSFDQTGTAIWRDWTSEHTGERVAVLIEGRIICSPTVAAPIPDGQLLVSGSNLKRPLTEEVGSAVVSQ